ncbi:MAG: glycine cleavage system protein GcvH [Candidatus Bathyarchaeia archaeon]
MENNIPSGLLYTSNHEWVRIVNDEATIGITSYAQDYMRGVLSIELPELGRKVKRNEAIATVETAKTILEIFSPLSGVILEVNMNLVERPLLIGQDPYGGGWIAKLKIENMSEAVELFDADRYRRYVEEMPEPTNTSDRNY